ncbi:MAG: hydroxymethylbilane synthase [Bordetella sp.]|nr:MAG: hydroxymethylbilane synthase [Bordetella sp.]
MLHPNHLIIATRSSLLAIKQAEQVKNIICSLYPNCTTEISSMKTRGDRILDRSISQIGGKGLFVKELELALIDGRADLAVHSLKDVPLNLEAPLEICSILKRGDPRDAFISNNYESLRDMPSGSIVGTSSLRRESQLRARYPSLIVKPLRGNIETRLRKLDNGVFSGIILAAIGLKRIGLENRICEFLETSDFLPSPGQGALGIEIDTRRSDIKSCLAPLSCKSTTACLKAERSVSRALSGSCQIPLAAYAQIHPDNKLLLQALVSSPDGKNFIYGKQIGSITDADIMGKNMAKYLLDQGANLILKKFS